MQLVNRPEVGMPLAEAVQQGLPTSGRFISGYRNGRLGQHPVLRPIATRDCSCCGEPFLTVPDSRQALCNPCRQGRLRDRWKERKRAYRAALAPDPTTTCEHCGAGFERKRKTARFCSTACRVAAHRASKPTSKPRRFQVTSLLMQNPPNGKRVMRPSRWGNPFTIEAEGSAAAAVAKFRQHLAGHPELVELGRRELRGFDLGCTCPLGEPCHADVWLEAVND